MRDPGSTAGAAVTVATSSPYWAYAFHGADDDWAIRPDRILIPNLPVSFNYLIYIDKNIALSTFFY